MKTENIIITENIIKYAKKKGEKIGPIDKSITNGDGNAAGVIGELLVLGVMGLTMENLKSSESYDYDIIDNDGIKWDVKTKRRTVDPKPYYNCTVADYNTKQKCDRYIFVSLRNLEEGFITGWISKKEFYEKASFANEGDLDPTSPKHKPFYFTADCYNIECKYLNKL